MHVQFSSRSTLNERVNLTRDHVDFISMSDLFQLPLCQPPQDFPITPINTPSPHSLSPPVRDVGMVRQH
jgi:hypothetical protein